MDTFVQFVVFPLIVIAVTGFFATPFRNPRLYLQLAPWALGCSVVIISFLVIYDFATWNAASAASEALLKTAAPPIDEQRIKLSEVTYAAVRDRQIPLWIIFSLMGFATATSVVMGFVQDAVQRGIQRDANR